LDLIHEINEEDIASIPVHPVVSLRVRLLHLLADGKSQILEISNILICNGGPSKSTEGRSYRVYRKFERPVLGHTY